MTAINEKARRAVASLRPGAITTHTAELLETGSGRLTGVPTGEASALDVIDIDPRRGGINACSRTAMHAGNAYASNCIELGPTGYVCCSITGMECGTAPAASHPASMSGAAADMSSGGRLLACLWHRKLPLRGALPGC
jgi:hypothetical protein